MHKDWEEFWKDPKEVALKKRVQVFQYNPQWQYPLIDNISWDNTKHHDIPDLSVTVPKNTEAFLYVLDKHYNNYCYLSSNKVDTLCKHEVSRDNSYPNNML